ncbi:MAG: hypothetical protein Q4C38_04605, partial [bacterium]|nr:hypothetical protein [bacterium]
DSARITLNGKDSVGMCAGINSAIRGKKGDWITLAEWKYDEDKERYVPVCVKSAQIDGKIIKENKFYILRDGEFKEC